MERCTVENGSDHSQKRPKAMAFYHEDGFVPAWKQAQRFSGSQGRIATLPDIIEARLNSRDDEVPWTMYFTTLSAEYFGYSRGENRILIVAHGIGPMSTQGGVLDAYSFQFKDKSRNRKGGRITREQFLKLESGEYGDVSIVDFDAYYRKYRYPFMNKLKLSEAKCDPLVRARFGARAEEYLDRHAQNARKWHFAERHGKVMDPYLLSMGDDNMYFASSSDNPDIITPYELDKHGGLPLAHLLSIGQIVYSHGNTENHFPDFFCDVHCHGWHDGTRLVSIHDKNPLKSIHPGANLSKILSKHWRELMVPTTMTVSSGGFHRLMRFDGELFTMYPKIGARMDSLEPEFRATKIKIFRGPRIFRTKGFGSPFFKYSIEEVKAIAPSGANAYMLGEPHLEKNTGNHTCDIRFYKVEVDVTKRLMRQKDIITNYDLMMSFV